MRLSRDGLTPISEHGMKDWFSDKLKIVEGFIIGSYDDKKSLYNVTLKSAETITTRATTPTGPLEFSITNMLGDWKSDWSYPNDINTFDQFDTNGVGNATNINSVTQIVIPPTDMQGYDRSSNFTSMISALSLYGVNNVLLHQQVAHGTDPKLYGVTQSSQSGPIASYEVSSITTDSSGNYVLEVAFQSGQQSLIDWAHFWWTPKNMDQEQSKPGGSSELDYTLSFAEKTNGWVSFKSWIQESGLSMNGKYYTFKEGSMYEHESNLTRNNFYGSQFVSTIDVLLNDGPSGIKSFNTLKYSGSQAKITRNIATGMNADGNNQFDQEYYNNFSKDGWYVTSAETDLQSGKVLEFKPKEGKWFTHMQGLSTYFNDASDTNVDEKEFSVQGIGYAASVGDHVVDPPTGCDDINVAALAYSDTTGMVFISPMPNAEDLPYTFTLTDANGVSYPNTGINVPNYGGPPPGPGPTTRFPNLPVGTYTYVTTSASGCTSTETIIVSQSDIYGCTDPAATNYDPNATIDDGSCIYPGSSSHTLTVKDNPLDH